MKDVRFVVLCLLLTVPCSMHAARPVSIATFNVYGAGLNSGQPVTATVRALRAINADIVALQEVRAEAADCTASNCPPSGPSIAGLLASSLGYEVFEQAGRSNSTWANAILTRYPVRDALPGGLGAVLDLDGEPLAVLNVHFPDYPYQPYQLNRIPYGDAPFLTTPRAAVLAAEAARGSEVDALLEVIQALGETALIVVCGDFNEPSHLDWTESAVRAGLHPMAVGFPASLKLAAAGLVDAYRLYRPDEVAFPGFTWTPLAGEDDPAEHHDRIDFIYLKSPRLRLLRAEVVGESPANADIVADPWPSDHRAVRVGAEL